MKGGLAAELTRLPCPAKIFLFIFLLTIQKTPNDWCRLNQEAADAREKNPLLVGNLRNTPDDRLHRLPRDENSRYGADKNVVLFGE